MRKASILLVGFIAASTVHANDVWTTHHANVYHNGYVPLTLDTSRMSLIWSRNLSSDGNATLWPATIASGRAYVSVDDYPAGALIAFDEATGAEIWRQSYPDIDTISQATYDSGRVYVQTENHTPDTFLRSYDAVSGGFAFESPIPAQWYQFYAPEVVDGVAYVSGGYYGGMYAFNAIGGGQIWENTTLPQYDEWTPMTSGAWSMAYLGDYDPGLYIIDSATGAQVNMIPDPEFEWGGWSMGQAAVLGSMGEVVVTNDSYQDGDSRIIAFDLVNQSIRYQIWGDFAGQVTLGDYQIFVVDPKKPGLQARAEADGSLLWTWTSPEDFDLGYVGNILTNNHVVVHTGKTTYAVDRQTHQATWSYPAGGTIALSDTTLYIGDDDDGTLSAINIFGGCLTLAPSTLPDGRLGQGYNEQLSATGGTGTYTYSADAATLPPGLALNAGGFVYGTPTEIGRYAFTVVVQDATGCSGSEQYTVGIGTDTDFVSGAGLGGSSPNRVRVHTAGGTPTSVDFLAYGAGRFGVNVGAADIRGIAEPQIVTGPGPGDVFGPQVRAFAKDGTAIAKVNYFAYGTLKYGVNLSGSRLDGDAFHELLTGAGPGSVFGPHVRGWNYDDAAVAAVSKVNFFAYSTLKFGTNVASGDIDDDGFGELLSGPGPGLIFGPQIRGFNHDGGAVTALAKVNFVAYNVLQYGANLASGSSDYDDYAEIATAPGAGPGPSFQGQIRGFDYDGSAIYATFDTTAFTTYFGGRVGHGDMDEDGQGEVVAGAGRDPAADATVKDYRGGYSLVDNTFNAFPGYGYGVNATGAMLGY